MIFAEGQHAIVNLGEPGGCRVGAGRCRCRIEVVFGARPHQAQCDSALPPVYRVLVLEGPAQGRRFDVSHIHVEEPEQ